MKAFNKGMRSVLVFGRCSLGKFFPMGVTAGFWKELFSCWLKIGKWLNCQISNSRHCRFARRGPLSLHQNQKWSPYFPLQIRLNIYMQKSKIQEYLYSEDVDCGYPQCISSLWRWNSRPFAPRMPDLRVVLYMRCRWERIDTLNTRSIKQLDFFRHDYSSYTMFQLLL